MENNNERVGHPSRDEAQKSGIDARTGRLHDHAAQGMKRFYAAVPASLEEVEGRLVASGKKMQNDVPV